MKIAIGCDHGGYALLAPVKKHLEEEGIEVDSYGSKHGERAEYPQVAAEVAWAVARGDYPWAILMCGTGIGISIAANKIPGIRCANVAETYSATMARRHNNANILAMGGRTIGDQLALAIVDAYRAAEFEGGRHQVRIDAISALEEK